MKPLISAENLIAFRCKKALFAPVTLQVQRGEIALLRGGNGVGKSTLLDCFAGRYFDWTGSLSCLSGLRSYLPQDPQHPLTIPLSKLAHLAIGFQPSRYEYLLDVFQLREMADKTPSLLSGGELQKSRLLLSLLRSHEVLLLDEPFANVDDVCRAALSEELVRSSSTRATILVSHPTDSGKLQSYGTTEFNLLPSIH